MKCEIFSPTFTLKGGPISCMSDKTIIDNY